VPDFTQIGEAGATLVKTGREFDPNVGFVNIQTYEGNQAAIYALEAGFTAARARTHVDHDGPVYTLEVRSGTPSNPLTEQPVDKWNIDIDFVQESIWSAPKFLAAAAPVALAADKTLDDLIAYWKMRVKDEQAKESPDTSAWVSPIKEMYAAINRGQEAYETERPVLSRVRTISASYAGQVVLEAVPTVYTTDSLVFYFGIPLTISSRLPPNPTYTPPFTAWGWKKRKDTSEFILALNKVQEVKDWVFAAWNTLTYEII
jgi:hypothetical protein